MEEKPLHVATCNTISVAQVERLPVRFVAVPRGAFPLPPTTSEARQRRLSHYYEDVILITLSHVVLAIFEFLCPRIKVLKAF